MGSDLTDKFDKSRAKPTGETLEQIRHNYFIAAKMNGSDDKSVGGLNINTSGRNDTAAMEKKKREQASTDLMLMQLLETSLASLEEAMIEKYGEDFAENLAAEFLDEDTYKKLMEIEDPQERRKAIARAINDGIANGAIDPDKIYQNPDIKEWLDTHAELAQAHYDQVAKATSDQYGTQDAEKSTSFAKDEAQAKGLDAAFT